MRLIWFIWIALQVLIGYNLILPLAIYFISLFKSRPAASSSRTEIDYAIIVTAYEQVTTLPGVVKSLLELNYQNYLIYLVADKCDNSELYFDDKRVIVLRPPQTLSSNTKSHFYAINNFKRTHDRLTIIDSDNLVHPEYLNELNVCFSQGYEAVQGLREAKNLDTTYACLDAARDIYYHFYDGEILFKAGSSATLSGSGMAFNVALYRDCLEGKNVEGAGFDKVLQAAIVERGLQIAFTRLAIVYDEKTSRVDQLVNQRSRWINTWFRYFKYGFLLIGKGIRRLNWNQFLFGFILLRPPLFIFLLLSFLCFSINLFTSINGVIFWLSGFVLFVFGFFMALLKSSTDKRIYVSLINIPRFVFFQVVALLKARNANQRSVATVHYHYESSGKIIEDDEN